MEPFLIKVNGTQLKMPSTYKVSWEDTDSDSFRSVVNGDLNRNRVAPRWVKLQLHWNLCSDAEVDTIARAVNSNQEFTCECKAPAFGRNGWVSFPAYCSKYEAEMLEAQLGWTMSLNIIQSKHGTNQESK